jgi:single-stranded DNA-binding protein
VEVVDVNLVVLAGELTTAPELRVFESGSRLLRMLVTLRVEEPRKRLDVVPVSWWDPDEGVAAGLARKQRVVVSGSIQRRFWEGPDGRRNRLEVVAESVTIAEPALEGGVATAQSSS